jgi:hypothetical protein
MITERDFWDITSGTWSPEAKCIHNIWTTLFAAVGRSFSPEVVKRPGWFNKSEWTTNQQKAFREFLIKEAMQHLDKTKPAATRLANRFVRDYGWKVHDRMQPALERGTEVIRTLEAAEGGSIDGKRVAHLLEISEAAVRRRWLQYRLVAWQKGKRVFYPKWQFKDGCLLPGIEEVLQVLQSEDHWRVMRYFLGERRSLRGQRPLDLLCAGKAADVLRHVKTHLKENTW